MLKPNWWKFTARLVQLLLGATIIVMIVSGAGVMLEFSEAGRFLEALGMLAIGGISGTGCLYAIFVIEDTIKGE